ncbi:hypothetical protein PPERSA_03376 [Pseudocohnilembus persalinus]|uniref:Uncharacterized protein n=1 Tax=Pseudocohnilembus persalinus TaxID=266149 RepID=A0A0V0R1I9_PSEPJ|nr:hypothetical protein PPERSA_03376 [Pseudocohnilembus persalinus]|eukprot:KRX08382.1 hypothetical protein PPERSA_03376 [Pseudocohnilembus persalinus]
MEEIKRDISPVQRQIKENLKIYKMQQEMSFEQGLNSNRNKDEQKISLFEQMRNQKLEENKLLLGNKLNDNRYIKKEKSKIDEDFQILKHLDDIQEQRNNINSKLYLQQEQKQTGKYSLTNSSKSSLQNDEQNQPKDLNFKKKKVNNFFNYHEVHGSQNNEGLQKENQQSDINIEESNKENQQQGNQQIMKNQNNQIQEKQERKNIWQNSEEIISKIKQREKQNNDDNKNDFIYNTNEKQQKLSRQNSKKDYSRGRKALNIVMSVDKLRKNVDTWS